MTDRGVVAVAEGCPDLRVLSLSGCQNLTISSARYVGFLTFGQDRARCNPKSFLRYSHVSHFVTSSHLHTHRKQELQCTVNLQLRAEATVEQYELSVAFERINITNI